MAREELTSDGKDVVSSIIDKATEDLHRRSLHALERAPINDGIQYIKTLQCESGGFKLMDGVEATPLMTGYALLTMGLVGLQIEDPAPAAAINYLKALQHPTGGIGYYLDSTPSLGPTAVIIQALKRLGAPRSIPLLQSAQKFISEKLQDGYWRESSAINGKSDTGIEVGLTALCASAMKDVLLTSNRESIIKALIEARNHDGGWGWSTGYESDVDHTAMAIIAILDLSEAGGIDLPDIKSALTQGREYILSCHQKDGGFSQRSGRDGSSSIDASGLAVVALSRLARPTDEVLRKAAAYFLRTQNADGGWGDKPGSDSDLDSTFFVTHALMQSGETIITLQEAEVSMRGLESDLKDLFHERITVVTDERDDLAKELKSAERKVQMLEAAIGVIVTIASILLAVAGIPGFD